MLTSFVLIFAAKPILNYAGVETVSFLSLVLQSIVYYVYCSSKACVFNLLMPMEWDIYIYIYSMASNDYKYMHIYKAFFLGAQL